MKQKCCIKCGKLKILSGFYVHPKMADGHLNKCILCTRAEVTANRKARKEYYKEYDQQRDRLPHRQEMRRAYQAGPSGHAAHARALRAYQKRYPVRYRAHYLLSNAIRDDRIKKGSCEVCGTKQNVEAHHDDYSRPLDVRWLCGKHHADVTWRSF